MMFLFYDPMDFPSLLQNSHILLNYLEELILAFVFRLKLFRKPHSIQSYLQATSIYQNLPSGTHITNV